MSVRLSVVSRSRLDRLPVSANKIAMCAWRDREVDSSMFLGEASLFIIIIIRCRFFHGDSPTHHCESDTCILLQSDGEIGLRLRRGFDRIQPGVPCWYLIKSSCTKSECIRA